MKQSTIQVQEQGPGNGFAGTLRNIQLTDIVQMCCLAGASLCVRVKQDADTGTIYIQEGEVVHAECGQINGIKAFFVILGWKRGVFETLDFSGIEVQTIKEPCQFLLMEAARLSDELSLQSKPEGGKAEPEAKLRVMIVDDSPIMSKIISSMLAADPSIEVIASAKNGEDALAKIKVLSPELITMDVNMPVMDGSTALKHIMIESPCPVMIMSNLGSSSYSTILSFLNLGAVDFISKPVKTKNILIQQQKMVDRIHIAAKAKVKRFQRLRCPKIDTSNYIQIDEHRHSDRLVILNSGVGGYLEMVSVITSLPFETNASLVSLQSIPPAFSQTLAAFLNARSPFEVIPIEYEAILCPGRCYIGTIGSKLAVKQIQNKKVISNQNHVETITDNSYDRFLKTAVEYYKNKITVILLSGADLGGMQGLQDVKYAGGKIIAPKLANCILPASLEPAVDNGVVTELFDPGEMREVLRLICS
jgi:two-component system, chemotaxis family, protein-glutamate methylesterase/glutaminase